MNTWAVKSIYVLWSNPQGISCETNKNLAAVQVNRADDLRICTMYTICSSYSHFFRETKKNSKWLPTRSRRIQSNAFPIHIPNTGTHILGISVRLSSMIRLISTSLCMRRDAMQMKKNVVANSRISDCKMNSYVIRNGIGGFLHSFR